MSADIDRMLERQLAAWPWLAERVDAVRSQTVSRRGEYTVIWNPARRVSTGADLSAEAVSGRPCPLCAGARPAGQQVLMRAHGYELLANPFPVVWPHLTIVSELHQPQVVKGHEREFVDWVMELDGMAVFYNAAGCGASCPGHRHFQAVDSRAVPMLSSPALQQRPGIRVLAGLTAAEAPGRLAALLAALAGEGEPMVNLLGTSHGDGTLDIYVMARSRQRPACYSADPDDMEGYMVSPATLEMCGCIVTPLRKDFERIDTATIDRIINEVSQPL